MTETCHIYRLNPFFCINCWISSSKYRQFWRLHNTFFWNQIDIETSRIQIIVQSFVQHIDEWYSFWRKIQHQQLFSWKITMISRDFVYWKRLIFRTHLFIYKTKNNNMNVQKSQAVSPLNNFMNRFRAYNIFEENYCKKYAHIIYKSY